MEDFKLAVIMLDGCILDLNRYRFNYYKHLCEDYNINITKEEFYDSLGNMNTMYLNLPLNNRKKADKLNKTIEQQLYDYLSLKGIYPRDGLFELLDYFYRKNIKVAVISTHSTKRAIEYLKLCRVYSHVNYIIGSDTKIKPLPSNEILKAISIQFDTKYEDILFISSILPFNKLAMELHCKVFYFKDLIEPRKQELESSNYVVNTFFDILNHLLFDRLYDQDMYSKILGMENVDNKEKLDSINDHLKEVYQDDPKLLDIVENTYQYNLSTLTNEPKKETIVDNEPTKVINKEEIVVEEPKIEEKQTHDSALSLNEQETLELTNVWNKLVDNNEENKEIETKEKEEQEFTTRQYILYVISELLYSIILSLFIVIIGFILTIVFSDYASIYSFLNRIFNVYMIPISYISKYFYINNISYLANITLVIFIFNSIIIFVIKIIYFILRKDKIIKDNIL